MVPKDHERWYQCIKILQGHGGMIKMQTLSHLTKQLHPSDQKQAYNLDLETYKHKDVSLHHTQVPEGRWKLRYSDAKL